MVRRHRPPPPPLPCSPALDSVKINQLTKPFLPPLANNSKHVLNAQVSIRSPCCKKWFDCAECHAEQEANHELLKTLEMTFACKKCKKCFRKDAREFEEADEYCPHCDNHFVLEALIPKPALSIEAEDARVDSRMLRDDRVKPGQDRKTRPTVFDPDFEADKLG